MRVNARTKCIKIRPGDRIGQRFKECREFHKKSMNDIGEYSVVYAFETSKAYPDLLRVMEHSIPLGIREVQFQISDTGRSIKGSYQEVGKVMKTLRKTNKKLAQKDVRGITGFTAFRIERGEPCNTKSLILFAKQLGIKDITIKIDEQ